MAYSFEQLLAADPSNPSNIAQNGSITIFAPGDPTMTPLTITDPDGSPLPNPFTVNANGFGPAFAHATLDRVAWSGGGFTGFVTSYEGMKEEAVAARAAAETAAAEAGAQAAVRLDELIAAGSFEGPAGPLTNLTVGTVEATPGNPLTGAIVASEVTTAGTATKIAIDATISRRVETEFHDSFAGKPDGAVPVSDSGHTYTLYPPDGNRKPVLRGGKLTFATDNPGATTYGSGGYANIKTLHPITHAEASFTLTPWTTVGGLACLALMTDNMVGTTHVSPAHLIVAPEYWSFGVFTAPNVPITILKQVNYKTNLVADGVKVHTMSVDIDRTAGIAYVSVPYPDGSQQTFAIQHDTIKTAAYAGYIEPYQGTTGGADYSLAEFTEWGLGTGNSRSAHRTKEIHSRQEQMTSKVVALASNMTLTTSFVAVPGVTISGTFGKTGKCRFDVSVPIQHRGPADVYFVLNDGANGNVGSTNTRVLKGRPTIVDAADVEDRNVMFKMDAAGDPGKEFTYALHAVAFGVNTVESPPGPKALIRSGAGYNVIIDALPY